jgi:predicted alpha/beta superfamily hydrolase
MHHWLRGALITAVVLQGGVVAAAEMPAAVPLAGPGITGTLLRHAAVPSQHVTARNVDVWLPPGYDADPQRRYPVLYMHDGQNLFDPATAFGGTDWAVDEAMTRLIADGKVRDAIVVGIWNSPKRREEYMPQRAVQGAEIRFNVPGTGGVKPSDIISDRYLAFLVDELKPYIDATYRTLPGRDDTFVMGSSMGGLVSQYAVSRYPDVYGGAGCVSTHWPAGDGVAVDDFGAHLPDPATHRYWFDYGTKTLDAKYEPYQQRADALLRKAGYVEGQNWITRKFAGAEHSEKAWRLRVDQPLEFLLRPAAAH